MQSRHPAAGSLVFLAVFGVAAFGYAPSSETFTGSTDQGRAFSLTADAGGLNVTPISMNAVITTPAVCTATITTAWSATLVLTRVIGLSGDLAFGSVTVGTTPNRTLTISNSGNSALAVSGITYSSGFSGAWSGAVAAGRSQPVTVTLRRSSGGERHRRRGATMC